MMPSIPSIAVPSTPSPLPSAATTGALTTKWEQCLALAQEGPLSVASDIAGRHGPLQITHGWMKEHMPENERERNVAGQALLALAGKSAVTDIREYPSHPRGTATLRSGDVVTYRFTRDGYGSLPPGAIAFITVRTKEGRAVKMGCWTPDVGGRVSLENDSDAASGARQPGYRLNASLDDYARAADIYGWRP